VCCQGGNRKYIEDLTLNILCFQSFTPPVLDSGVTVTNYERTHAHNEELGLNDMKTENYETCDD